MNKVIVNLRLIRVPLAMLAIIVLVINFGFALFAPIIAPHDPNEVALARKLSSPSTDYPLGTDHLGRCVLSRLIYGARVSLGTAFTVMSITLSVSLVVGSLSGCAGGIVDSVLMRICDLFLAFPSLILALALVGVMGPGLMNIVLALVISQWAWYTRLIRGMVLSVKERNYIAAARVSGTSTSGIIGRHVLPNVVPQVVVLAAMDIGWAILHISSMSFLGLGIQPPTPEWGAMINDGRQFLRGYPSLMLYPGLMILSVVMSFNLLGDVLRDNLDPVNKR